MPFPSPEEAPVEEEIPVSFEDTQTITDDVLLNERQVTKILLGNDSHPPEIFCTPKR